MSGRIMTSDGQLNDPKPLISINYPNIYGFISNLKYIITDGIIFIHINIGLHFIKIYNLYLRTASINGTFLIGGHS